MRLTPRYDEPGFFRLDLDLGDVAVPLLRQRERMTAALARLDDEQWATPSRCEGWSAKDVVAHLTVANQFWAIAVSTGRAGEPTRLLATFDPVASPIEHVDATRTESPTAVLARFVATNDALADAVAGLDATGWSALGEAPPGHVPLRAVALHALWDAWVHERDVFLPLGLPPVEEPDEIVSSLAYAAALGPALALCQGETRSGSISVEPSDAAARIVVDAGPTMVVRGGDAPADALRLAGPAVELLEGLSRRAPLPCPVPDERAWLLAGLAQAFDQPV
jgi:uncharacterized protein (TIGR03083 family)